MGSTLELRPPRGHSVWIVRESCLRQITQDLIDRGARAERLHSERFVPDTDFDETGAAGTLAASGMAVNEARVLFRRSAKEARWRAIESLTLLELAQTVGLELLFSCRSGYCQTCQCRIIEGEARYAYAPLCAPAPGHALLCCARPRPQCSCWTPKQNDSSR